MHQAALQMLEARRYRRSRTRTIGQICVSGAFCFPVGFLSELARTMYLSSFETGDLNYGGQGAMHMTIYGLLGGRDLDQVRREAIESYESLRQQNQVVMAVWLSMFLEGAIAFQEGLGELGHLTGRYFDEHAYLPSAQAANDFTGMHFLASMKLVLTYHFDLDGELLACLHAANRATVGAAGMLTLGVTKWYSTLAWLRLFPGLTPEDRTRALSEVDRSLEHLGIWSQSAPKTFGHVVHLAMAEKARVTGTTDEALSHYERAIEDARESGFIQDEALANELYARFWAERGSERFAAPLMREAYSLYWKWGAHAKAEHLAKRYPNWLIGRRIVVDEPATGSISAEMPGGLDLGTVLKTSQDIASELLLDGLLAKLMAHVIESSGAQKGYLILQEEGHWTIVSEASADDPQRSARTAKHIDESDALATGIVRYVARTQQAVALEDASGSGDFVNDPYVQAHRARSILCTPLVNRGKITAILYLENNLAPGAFSPERVGLLRLLSSQMAISIENARIHADLEALLDSRSKALASAEAQVRTLFESSPVGIALSNPDGWLLSVNKAVLDMVRIKEDELLEHNVVDFYDDPGDRDALLRELNESGMVQDFGVRLVRRDGSRFYASMNVSKLVIEGNEVLLAMVQDVTAQINAEQESAALGERARLARELHDAVSQTIFSASLLADTAVRASKAGRAVLTQDLDNLRRMLRGALDELRTMLLELRPVALQDRTLGQMLGTLAETARGRSSAAVDLEIKGDRVLPERVTTTLYRIAQESLNNAVRHAAAQRIRIDLACDPDEVVLVICDDGLGFDIGSSSAGHHGLDIMRERAEEIGAVLEIESRAGSGTRVTANWS
jgi:PAS domain S-box-containing protein